jgi:hypothetical protein
MGHSNARWNIEFHKRANLALLPKEFHLVNDPWFVLTRENAIDIINFVVNEYKLCNTICNGGLANESLFAIVFTYYKKIQNVINQSTHVTDWIRMSSSTSPHLFQEGNIEDIQFIENFLAKNEFAMFIRKVHPNFPNEILKKYIYHESGQYKEIRYHNYFHNYLEMYVSINTAIYTIIIVCFISFFIVINFSNSFL